MFAPHIVQTPVASDATPALPCALTLSDSALSMGLLNIGGRGSGKTTLFALLALLLLRKGTPQVIIDPLGTLTDALLHLLLRSLQRVPPEKHAKIWRRLRYIDVGNQAVVTPFPIYAKRDGESLWDTSERLLHVLELSHPNLITQSSVTWPRARRVADNAGAVLAALNFQLTEVEDLFFNTLAWEKNGLFAEAIARCPEALPAVKYFREEYPLRQSERLQLTGAFLDHVYRFTRHPALRLLFGARTPGLDLEAVEEKGETVILDFRSVANPDVRRFALLWIFHFLYDHIKRRGRRQTILGLMIDEFAELTTSVTGGAVNPLAVLFDEFLQRYMRNHRIFFSCAFQSITQLDEHLRNTLISLGTLVVGRIATMEEARELADVLFQTDPYFVKHWRKVWGTRELVNPENPNRPGTLVNAVIDHEPEHMPLPEQLELAAQKLTTNLQAFHFLTRPAIREGEVSQAVIPISIAGIVRDRKTGEYVVPNGELVERRRAYLANRSGIPAETIRQEQEARLACRPACRQAGQAGLSRDTSHAPQPAAPRHLPPEGNGRQPFTHDNGAHPEPQPVKENPPLPTLDEQQKSLLTFISEHPDTPVSSLYKALGVSVWKGNELRDSLKAQGLLTEVEIRTGRTTAGRPAKFVLLTFQTYTLFGIQPPAGRGGVIHRHVQQMITEGATAKGYTAQVEKELGNGAIVDVHLANGQQKIAVEFAVVSTPEREITHIRNCLAVGYDQVYALFADENLLARTATEIQAAFSQQEAEKVRLLPLSQLPHVG